MVKMNFKLENGNIQAIIAELRHYKIIYSVLLCQNEFCFIIAREGTLMI